MRQPVSKKVGKSSAKVAADRGIIQVNVKFTPEIQPNQREDLLKQTVGLRKFVQTFPEETDLDLKGLYVLDLDPSDLDAAINQLNANACVEYAEVVAPRKLIGRLLAGRT